MTATASTSNGDLAPLWTAISIAGADARSFLQAQLSCDINLLSPQRSIVGALCSPKGRVLALLLLVDRGDEVVALTHPSLAATIVKRLQMFVLRSKVTIEASDQPIGGRIEDASGETSSWDALETRHEQGGVVVHWAAGRTIRVGHRESDKDIADAWLSADCAAGLPTVTDVSSDQHVAQMLNLDRLGAVSFRKGCYPGQEIIARAHYRGQVKRRLHRFACRQPLPVGTRLLEADRAVGEVLICGPQAQGETHPLVAVVRDEHATTTLHAEAPADLPVNPIESPAEPNAL